MAGKPEDMICTVVAADTVDRLGQAALSAPTRLVELRVDLLHTPPSRDTVRRVAGLIRELEGRGIGTVVTLRDSSEGGGFKGSPAFKEEALLALAEAGSRYLDVELSFPRRRSVVEAARRLGVKVILSAHVFDRVPRPGELRAAAMEAFRLRASVFKAVFPARSPRDNVVALKLCDRWPGRVISFCLGRAGVVSRLLAPLFGAPFTYAYPDDGRPVAPGQLSVGEVIRLWREMGIA